MATQEEKILRSNEFMVIQSAIAAANFAIGAFTVELKAQEAMKNQEMVTRLQGALNKAKEDRKFAMGLLDVQLEGNFNDEGDFKRVLDLVHSYNSLIDHSLINGRSAFLPLAAVPHMRFDKYEEQ
ncbi:hypothetical protein [Tumebacillus flagellatus]|uniref:Uncharacterized protein n=1 Tax=Tumebacillus flagellatus TaxID=1157490 RepID=A0A074LWP2_9BACL|nr:hypothetical protein [Tumebacillus flagellatus]KEO84508.1 hypothetical protein EL26_03025 [Tumebacillus flagellatus]